VRTVTGLLGTLFVLALTAPVNAETTIGAFGGVNLATLHEAPSEQGLAFSTKGLPEAGAVVDVTLGRRLSLRLEPMFLQKGSGISVNLFGTPSTATLRLSYLELPALLSLTLGAGPVRPYVMAGPTVGYLMSAKGTNDATGKETDVLKQYKRTDFGVSFGGGVRVPAGGAVVFVEGRYSMGLTNLPKDTGSAPGLTLKNRGVQVGLGVSFRLGHH
jgi:hypothetical protein